MASSLAPTGVRASSFASTSDSKLGQTPILKYQLRDKKVVNINDHIYLSAPWAPGAGDPYVIGRVMEFVNPAIKRGASHQPQYSGPVKLQVRVNVFLRSRDISSRPSQDPRLLVATMHSDLFSVDNIRGLCNVRHRDLIGDGHAPDIGAWKKREDHFYYYQLYDRYIHRSYDVIPTEKLRNAPPDVLAVLRQRYSFIVAELGMTQDLCDAMRGCQVCHRWAAGNQSIRCDTCRKFFHMTCLDPPVSSRPAKGYSWSCAPCAKQHQEDVDKSKTGGAIGKAGAGDYASTSRTSSSSAPAARTVASNAIRGRERGRGRGRGGRSRTGTPIADSRGDGSPAPQRSSDEDVRGVRCFQGWPYRYFGEHTAATDVFDPHDSIYPRATTRIGPKFQANNVTWEEQLELGLGVNPQATAIQNGTKAKQEAAAASSKEAVPIPAGLVPTVAELTGTETEDVATTIEPEAPPIADVVRTKGVKRKRDDDGAALAAKAAHVEAPDANDIYERGGDETVTEIFDPEQFSKTDAQATTLEQYLRLAQLHFPELPAYNVELMAVSLQEYTAAHGILQDAIRAMTQKDLSSFNYAQWDQKEIKRFETVLSDYGGADMGQLKKFLPGRTPAQIVRFYYAWKTSKLRDQWRAEQAAQHSKVKPKPKEPEFYTATSAGTTRPVSPSLSVLDLPVNSAGHAIHGNRSCYMCSTNHSTIWYKGPMSWNNRALCVHCGVYWRKYAAESTPSQELVTIQKKPTVEDTGLGVLLPAVNRIRTVNLIPECVLCPARTVEKLAATGSNLSSAVRRTTKQIQASREESEEAACPPLTILDAVKPTEGNNWAHTLCSLWIPEIAYSNAHILRDVEGAGFLPSWRYQAKCEICGVRHGACISCAESSCKNTFHVTCAFIKRPDYTFAFEIQPVKSSRRDAVPTVSFKDETGNMSALVWCKDHREQTKGKTLYELHEVDPRTGLTALQLYARTHKTIQAIAPTVAAAITSNSSYALLRKARRFDAIITSGSGTGAATGASLTQIHRNAGTGIAGVVESAAAVAAGSAGSSSSSSSSQKLPAAGGPSAMAAVALVVEKENAKKKLKTGAQYECERCKTHFSPAWWPVEAEEDERMELMAPNVLPPSLLSSLPEEGAVVPASALEAGQRRMIQVPVSNISSTGAAVGPPDGRKVCCNRCRVDVRPDLHL
ncbi:putative PHD type zinc finger protein with BAH domain-containing protein [Tilletia horrida]|nr:putative PHD type zinc finger protein with BAH domain-containing protein [Tilletia horrida]